MIATTRAAVFLLLLGAGIGFFFFDQRAAVGHRDLIVIGVNFGKGEEPMAVAAVIHKGGLQGWLHPCDLCQIDIPGELPLVYCFKVEFLDLVSVDHHNPSFLGMGGVDEHFLSHIIPLRLQRTKPTGEPVGFSYERRRLVRAVARGCMCWAMPCGHTSACSIVFARVIAVHV